MNLTAIWLKQSFPNKNASLLSFKWLICQSVLKKNLDEITKIYENGLEENGPSYEVYVNDPSTVDESEIMTQICVPVK